MKKIAILDDGINECMEVDYKIQKRRNYYDEICHGSLVVATIEKYCHEKKMYYIYDVYNTKKQEKEIIKALWKCLLEQIDVIVMSFTIPINIYYLPIALLLSILSKHNIVIVAADNNSKEKKGYPAFSKYTIGVGNAESKLMEFGKRGIQVIENVKPEFVQCGENYCLFSGTSKANAIVAARVVKSELNIRQKALIKTIHKQNDKNETIIKKCKKVLITEKNINFFSGDYDIHTIEKMVLLLLKEYNMEKFCLEMEFEDIESIETVANFIVRKNE